MEKRIKTPEQIERAKEMNKSVAKRRREYMNSLSKEQQDEIKSLRHYTVKTIATIRWNGY